MKPLHKIALLSCMMAFSGAALADHHQSLIGTWVGQSNSAIIGNAPHHVEKKDKTVRFVSTEFQIVIDKEQGLNFSGYLMSKSNKEPLAGAFMADLINGVYVDSDGAGIFKRMGQNLLEMCYVHTPGKTTDSSVASCTQFTRK